MQTSKKYTSTTFCFQSKYEPEQIWELLIDPIRNNGFKKNQCYYNEIDSSFKLEKNHSWKEIHTGESCKGDIVKNTIKKITPYSYFKTVRFQAGIKNTSIYTLEKNAAGTLITEQQKFVFSLRNFSPSAIILWIMLVTGLLTKLGFKPEEDLFWYENMEDAIEKSLLKT